YGGAGQGGAAGGVTGGAAGGAAGGASGGTVGGGPNVAQPKKKDPYATAWRTYSKIAEELQLLNPDGSLYPISKEAILKYLHHQSKRIKSSNLHWYVNGLKKHQENLGFPWDDVRYDEQVVSLLKELTFQPATVTENGDDDGHGHAAYGSQPNRQRQSSSSMYPSGKAGHHYSSSSIDMTRIANLSISQPPQHHSQQQQQQHQQQAHHHQAQQKQQMLHGPSNGSTPFKQQHQTHQQQQQQQISVQSQRTQQPPPPKTYYHSAPIQVPSHHVRTPSTQDATYHGGGGQQHHHHPSQSSSVGLVGPVDAHGIRSDTTGHPSSSSLTKRKRDEFAFKKRGVPSSMSIEGEDNEDDDLQDDELKDEDFDLEDKRGRDMDDFDEMEDRYQPLKRRASTGTLLNQAKAQAVKHIPGPFTLDQQHESGTHSYQRTQLRQPSTGGSGMIHRRPGDQQQPQQQQHQKNVQSPPSPDPRDDEPGGGGSSGGGQHPLSHRGRNSPPETGSSSFTMGAGGVPHQIGERESNQRYRHTGSGCTVTSPTMPLGSGHSSSTMAPSLGLVSASASTGGHGGKTTVHFSEVVECAQQLQLKYGNRCKDHPWGCVEITEHQHLELTIKMYLDWAGLVASGRLTMDDLPDLPEFRMIHPVVGGTLRRMASSPLSSSTTATTLNTSGNGGSVAAPVSSSSMATMSSFSPIPRRHATAEDTGLGDLTCLGGGPYRSPSSSPPTHHNQQQQHQQHQHGKDLSAEKSHLLNNIGGLPLASTSPALGSIPSPPSGTTHTISAGTCTSNTDNGATVGGSPPRARKMPSTPSLGLQHSQGLDKQHPPQQHGDNVKRSSMASISTASSPSSDAEMLEEDVEEVDVDEDEEEVIDVSHYALSPWAKAPRSIAVARAAAVRARNVKNGQHQEPSSSSSSSSSSSLSSPLLSSPPRQEILPFQERVSTTPKAAPVPVSFDLLEGEENQQQQQQQLQLQLQEEEETSAEEIENNVVLAMNVEGSVAAIGEIPDLEKSKTTSSDPTIRAIGNDPQKFFGGSADTKGQGGSVGVNSQKRVIIGGEDVRVLTEEAENKEIMKGEEDERGNHETDVEEKEWNLRHHRQMLDQEDSVMMET
ncbi:hypothetical protein BGZ65_004015, partial [Modicella reniformis]